jgi:hypothetical protein
MTARALGFASGITVTGNVTTGASQIDLTKFTGDMVSNITAANSAVSELRANITAANLAITTANVGMKTYVDTQVATAVVQASGYGNSVVAAYLPVNPTITAIQANTTAANLFIFSNAASINSINANITAANLNITSLQSNIIASNINITGLQSNIAAANVNISTLQTKTQFLTANVDGSVFVNNVFLGEGNLIVGNVNASGNITLAGIDATTLRFVRSPDTTVTTGEIYGNIDFASEDATAGASGVRARMSVASTGSQGQTEIKFYTGDGYSFGMFGSGAYPIGPTLITNTEGYFGTTAGFDNQVVPEFFTLNNFSGVDPKSNDSSMSYISQLKTSGVQKVYGATVGDSSFYEMDVAQTFVHNYAGFAGGDRANIALSAYIAPLGAPAMVYGDDGHTDLDISVQGLYTTDPAASPLVQKRLRKRWVATISYSTATGNYTILDQQLQNPVYNSDATNWAAGAVNAGKVFLQANATVGSQAVYLRLDSPTGAAVTSTIKWRWTVTYRTIASG